MKIHYIGDPHLGKIFKVGVPPHRRGERETKQMVRFVQELNEEADAIVMVGDLFDNPYVSRYVVVAAAQAALGAAMNNPHTEYWFIAGNHDMPRDLGTVAAWHTFEEIVNDRLPNLKALRFPQVTPSGIALFPWQWDALASDQVRALAEENNVHTVVGHWDLKIFDGKDDHLAPTRLIRQTWGDVLVVSGHWHVAGDYEVDGHTVHCTGSMEPYSHGEDPGEQMYITLTPEQAAVRTDLHDKCVRLVLPVGVEMPELDCLQLTALRQAEEKRDTLSVDEFNWDSILFSRIKKMEPVVQTFVRERLHVSEEQH